LLNYIVILRSAIAVLHACELLTSPQYVTEDPPAEALQHEVGFVIELVFSIECKGLETFSDFELFAKLAVPANISSPKNNFFIFK
jgi:hypothetical protein